MDDMEGMDTMDEMDTMDYMDVMNAHPVIVGADLCVCPRCPTVMRKNWVETQVCRYCLFGLARISAPNYLRCWCGSIASRRPSPRKLKANTVMKISAAGANSSHGWFVMVERLCASSSMMPQLTCGS